MAKADGQRWRDWRGNNRKPLHSSKTCECGELFAPIVRRQDACLRCIGNALAESKAVLALEEVAKVDRRLAEAELEERLVAAARLGNLRRGTPRGVSTRRDGPGGRREAKRNARGRARRSASKSWRHVVERKLRENWQPRKIAKFLGRPLPEVRAVIEEIKESQR